MIIINLTSSWQLTFVCMSYTGTISAACCDPNSCCVRNIRASELSTSHAVFANSSILVGHDASAKPHGPVACCLSRSKAWASTAFFSRFAFCLNCTACFYLFDWYRLQCSRYFYSSCKLSSSPFETRVCCSNENFQADQG